MAPPALEVLGVGKKFRRGELHDALRDLVPALLRRALRGGPPPELAPREFWALRDVSFAAAPGEALGVIGGNGAGKTTLLKLLGGILRPTLGTVRVQGRLSALIEVSAGFHPDLTGRENVHLWGTILGMPRRELARRFDAIVAFSGLEEFLDTPVKRYSSGMFARLGFSVAAHVDPDVLLVDEVLSVGDVVFQRRCMERMRQILREGTTVVFVSHNLRAVAELCDRVLLLERGRLAAAAEAGTAIQTYLGRALAGQRDVTDREAHVGRVEVRGVGGASTAFRSGEQAWVDVEIAARTACERLSITVYLADDDFRGVFDTSTERLGLGTFSLRAGEAFRCTLRLELHLAPGAYRVGVVLYRYDLQREYDRWFPAATLFVSADRDVRGVANLYPEVVAFGSAGNPALPQPPAAGPDGGGAGPVAR